MLTLDIHPQQPILTGARRILLFVGIALYFATAGAPAQSALPAIASLRGLRRVWVVMETLQPDLAAATDSSALRTEVELKLREHGLTVLAPGDTGIADGVIYVNAASVHSSQTPVWALSVSVYVQQVVTVTRLNLVDPRATTWGNGVTGIVGDSHVAQAVRDDVAGAIDSFLNAWLQVNPPSH